MPSPEPSWLHGPYAAAAYRAAREASAAAPALIWWDSPVAGIAANMAMYASSYVHAVHENRPTAALEEQRLTVRSLMASFLLLDADMVNVPGRIRPDGMDADIARLCDVPIARMHRGLAVLDASDTEDGAWLAERPRLWEAGAPLESALARISHRIRCIGARILRKSCCDHGFSQIHRTPQCKQTVTPHCLNFHPSEAAMLWPRSTVVRSPPMPARCCWARPTERSG